MPRRCWHCDQKLVDNECPTCGPDEEERLRIGFAMMDGEDPWDRDWEDDE